MLWESGETINESLTRFRDMEMRELLEGALTKVHEAHLQRIDWEILDRNYDEIVDKLEYQTTNNPGQRDGEAHGFHTRYYWQKEQ